MEKTTKKKVKKAILGVTSVALVAGVTSALTMAMLSDTESAENTFTATPNLSVQQVEPKWDGTNPSKLPNGNYPGYMDGDGSDQVYTSGDTGETTARSYVPDKPIAKNPYAVNTSTSPEYVALRVYYQVLCRRDSKLPYDGEGCCGKDEYGKYITSWHTISVEDFHKYFAETSYSSATDDANYNNKDFYKEIGDGGYSEYYYYGNSTTMKSLTSYFATPEIFDAVTPVESLNDCTNSAHADHHMFNVPGCPGCQAGRCIVNESLIGKGTDKKEIVLAVGDDDGLPEFRIVVQTAAIQTTYVNDSNDGTALSDVSTVRAELEKCFPDVPDKNSLSD